MRIESEELSELWSRIDVHMNNDFWKEELRKGYYSQSLHEKFTQLITKEQHRDAPPVAQELNPVLNKLQGALIQIIERQKAVISHVDADVEKKMGNIHVLFKNKAVDAQREKHEVPGLFPKLVKQDCESLLRLVEFASLNPRLQQTNPAMQGHSLDY